MPHTTAAGKSAYLVPLAGPVLDSIEVPARPGVTIGRQETCDLRLPVDADKVSRTHARLTFASGRWSIADLGSRWGTYLNGVKLDPHREFPLNEGDLIRITPWTFTFSSTRAERPGLESVNDLVEMRTMVRALSEKQAGALGEDMTALLLESAAGIHQAHDEQSLAKVILDVACRGTGLTHGALLRPVDAGGRVEVISTKWTTPIPGGQVYSRTLLQAASEGTVAELSSGSGPISESIIQNRIASAICAPILIGPTVAAYLYLDARDMTGAPAPVSLRRNAAAFCLALARMAGLALANLKRIDIERRSAMMEAELSAGAEAQRWILPRREGTFGPFSYIGESRPGTYVAGDFFDVIPLSDTKIAVALGDVSGKGVAASVLMTATQGYLHAALKQDADPARAVTELNRFVCPRRPESRFVTLWVGVFDAESRQVHYVDAGHGYALLAGPDGSCVQLAGGDGLPVGVMEDFIYKAHSATCAAGSRVLIVSDGLVEQMDPGPTNDPARRQFSLEGLQGCLAATAATDDAVAEVFRAVIAHAKTPNLADDATAVLVRL